MSFFSATCRGIRVKSYCPLHLARYFSPRDSLSISPCYHSDDLDLWPLVLFIDCLEYEDHRFSGHWLSVRSLWLSIYFFWKLKCLLPVHNLHSSLRLSFKPFEQILLWWHENKINFWRNWIGLFDLCLVNCVWKKWSADFNILFIPHRMTWK